MFDWTATYQHPCMILLCLLWPYTANKFGISCFLGALGQDFVLFYKEDGIATLHISPNNLDTVSEFVGQKVSPIHLVFIPV